MKTKKEDFKLYAITAVIILIIFLLVFITKGIFPFGKNSLIWGDMHDQITAFYYHFYDTFRGNSSLLIDFTTGGGVNFFGILTYYILSPVNFILLLFPRENIYLAVSIVVAFKFLISGLTCLYFLRYYFKKLPSALSIFLAISYAFSGYSLAMYQITPWMDVQYLFPLMMIGLKKVLDLEKPTWYIIILTISIICCFYISMMVLIFIFLASYIYLVVYKEKEERKKAILSLGISTVLSLLLSLFIIVPSYHQISLSSRLGFNLPSILNSKAGPLTDKLSFFMFGGIVYLGIILLLKNYKTDKKFLLWYMATILIVGIPVIVEPINKIWHFGSYAFFPYRFGFIAMFLLIIGAATGFSWGLSNQNEKTKHTHLKHEIPAEKKKLCLNIKMNYIIVGISTIVFATLIICLTNEKYIAFQNCLNRLTLSKDHQLLGLLFLTTFCSFIGCFIIYHFVKEWKKFFTVCIGILTIVHITANSFLYLGIDREQETLMEQYESLVELSKDYKEGDYYRVKNVTSSFMMNSGMVMKYHTLDHFTSLTDRNMIRNLKKLGYSSMWVKTFSKGGTLFSDVLLGNRYLISKAPIESDYYKFVKKYEDLNFYELYQKSSYGYFINEDVQTMTKGNSFEIQNEVYQKITNTKNNLFSIYQNWEPNNIRIKQGKEKDKYQIIDKKAYNYLEQTISVTDKQILYLEILNDLDNALNESIYYQFNIYVNDQLVRENALSGNNNGVMEIGTFENEEVNIKIEILDDLELDNLTVAGMDTLKYESFVENNQTPVNVKYDRNKILVDVESDKKQILFLPVSYNEGYRATRNKETVNVEKVFDGFIGIPVEEGQNEIEIKFVPAWLGKTSAVSFITLILTIILLRKDWYFKLLDSKVLQKVTSILYQIAYFFVLFGIYIGLTIIFILSYFIYFS